MPGVLIDNDVVIKMAAYDLCDDLVEISTCSSQPPAMLGVGRYVVSSRLSRSSELRDGAAALARFEAVLEGFLLVEPTEEEISAAADLESAAAGLNLRLDGGESQLLAVLVSRSASLLLTGDKRAIRAIAKVAFNHSRGKIVCLEQLVRALLDRLPVGQLKEKICREPLADRAIANCFSCTSSADVSVDDVQKAIDSYINHLREDVTDILAGPELLPVPPKKDSIRSD